jgi:uncharacterized coiled-coil DUF342 family protein
MDAHDATRTRTCKVANCANDAAADRGRYAGLCTDHIHAKRRAEAAAPRPQPSAGGAGFGDKVAQLARAAKDVDRLREKAKKLTAAALTAKQRADDAERELHALARDLIGDDFADVIHRVA